MQNNLRNIWDSEFGHDLGYIDFFIIRMCFLERDEDRCTQSTDGAHHRLGYLP